MANLEISSKLKKLRMQAGFSQKQAYEKIGVSQSTFSSWEIGKSEPDAETFLKLCDLYNVTNILSAFGYENALKSETQKFSYEAQVVAIAYDKAIPAIQSSVCKLLDVTIRQLSDEVSSELDIEKELADYRQELEAEQKGTISPVYDDTKEA